MTTPTPLRARPKLTLSAKRLAEAVQADPDTPSATDDARERRRTLAFRAFIVVLLVGLGALYLFTRSASNTETDLQTLLRSLELECAPGSGGELRRLCLLTEQVRQDNAAALATAAGLNTEQVIALVRAEIAANPPRDGQPASIAVVIDIVRQVLAENPALYRGEPGADATAEQVLIAAAAVMAADPEAFRGERGDNGPQGVGLGDLNFARRDGQCVAVVLLNDPATGTTRELTRPVADVVCPADPAPDPTEPPPPTDPPDPPVTDAPEGATEQPPPSTTQNPPPLFG